MPMSNKSNSGSSLAALRLAKANYSWLRHLNCHLVWKVFWPPVEGANKFPMSWPAASPFLHRNEWEYQEQIKLVFVLCLKHHLLIDDVLTVCLACWLCLSKQYSPESLKWLINIKSPQNWMIDNKARESKVHRGGGLEWVCQQIKSKQNDLSSSSRLNIALQQLNYFVDHSMPEYSWGKIYCGIPESS